jgi:hypothetical protein
VSGCGGEGAEGGGMVLLLVSGKERGIGGGM